MNLILNKSLKHLLLYSLPNWVFRRVASNYLNSGHILLIVKLFLRVINYNNRNLSTLPVNSLNVLIRLFAGLGHQAALNSVGWS